MTHPLIITLLVFCLSLPLSCQETQPTQHDTVEVILLAGQSNMAGAGNYDELDEGIKQRIKKVANRVMLSFNKEVAKPLSYYNNKPSEKYPFLKRFGPELLLGLTLAEHNPNKKYLLIKTSQGGTSLYGAWNPNWSAEKAKTLEKGFKQNLKLYEKHNNQISILLSNLDAENTPYKVTSLVWMQGENDASREVSSRSYKENLKILINSYRNSYNKNLLFVCGQINSRYGNFPEGPEMVRNAFVEVANEDTLSEVVTTTTDRSWPDYPKHKDNVHYNTEGQKRLGIAFANKLINLQPK